MKVEFRICLDPTNLNNAVDEITYSFKQWFAVVLIYDWLFAGELRRHSWTYGCTMTLLGRVLIRQLRVRLGKLSSSIIFFINLKTFLVSILVGWANDERKYKSYFNYILYKLKLYHFAAHFSKTQSDKTYLSRHFILTQGKIIRLVYFSRFHGLTYY